MKRQMLIRSLFSLVAFALLAAGVFACGGGGGYGGGGDGGSDGIATIGPEGGAVTSGDRLVTINFPPGSLAAQQTISIQKGSPADIATDLPGALVDSVYSLQPDGLQFAGPATVTVDLELPPSKEVLGIPAILTVSGTNRELVSHQGVNIDGPTGKTQVTGQLTHFSKLVVKKNIPASASISVLFDGIPDEVAPSSPFPVEVTVNHPATSTFRADQVLYRDASVRAVALTGGISQVLGALDPGTEKRLTGSFTYTCLPPPSSGTFNGTVAFNIENLAEAFAFYFGGANIAPDSRDDYFVRFVKEVRCPQPGSGTTGGTGGGGTTPTPTPAAGSGCGGLNGTYRGSGNCGIPSLTATSDGSTITFSPFGQNSSATFNAQGAAAFSTSGNLTILDATGHSCSLTCSSSSAFSMRCQRSNDASIYCDQTYAAT